MEAAQSAHKLYWGAKLTLFETEYSINTDTVNNPDIPQYNTKKAARNELAVIVLKDLDSLAYEEMLKGIYIHIYIYI
jgi:hypothetical protein